MTARTTTEPARTVLLAATGMSPAILTETLWALAKENPPVIPDDIVILTTTRGGHDLHNLLLGTPDGWPCSPWESLRQAILGPGSSPKLQLSAPRIIELPDPKSGVRTKAADIRTAADNAAAADFLLEEVRRLTENPDIRVIASLAGGRKTMGALLYACMSLLGRETDRLTHVLVSEPFETCRGFFYPDQPVQDIALPSGPTLRAKDAWIELADIPFVPLRNLFEKEMARRPGSFHVLVAEASRKIDPARKCPAIRAHIAKRELAFEGVTLTLPTSQFLVALLLLRRAKAGEPPIPHQTRAAEAASALGKELRQQADPDNFGDWRREAPIACDETLIRKALSALRKRLKGSSFGGGALEKAIESRQRVAWNLDPAIIRIA